MKNASGERRELYFRMNSLLSQLSTQKLAALLEGQKSEPGWGENQVIRIGRTKVFVKRIPATPVEYEHNHYRIVPLKRRQARLTETLPCSCTTSSPTCSETTARIPATTTPD